MSTYKILVVEDEAIVARDIMSQLEALGYSAVGSASNGEDAIALANTLAPDLVLMDIQLAGKMDGISAAQAICAERDVPVVFLTAFAADDVLTRAKLAQPYGYILKPFSERELHTVLEMALYKHQVETRLKDAAAHNQTILDNMADGVITIDEYGLIESLNRAACRIFGITSAEDVLGTNVSRLMPRPHRAQHNEYLRGYRETGVAHMIDRPRELFGMRCDGTEFPMNLSVSRGVTSGKVTFIGLVRDMSEHQQDQEEIRRLAFYDGLTGLPNRRLLIDRLEHAMQTSARTAQRGALMFLDLDHFKQLNDTLGHDLGDELLKLVAIRLQDCIRDGDSVARLGGDEFVVLLEALSKDELEAATQSEVVGIKILEALGRPYRLRDHAYTSTPSIGIVEFIGETKETLGTMQGRIRSMALLHESLYRSDSFAEVDLGEYLKQLSQQAFRAHILHAGAVRLELDLCSVNISVGQATPAGLLVNELISNSLKHGFPQERGGELRVSLSKVLDTQNLRLAVTDTGIGLPDNFAEQSSRSLGLVLVSDLARQIGGSLEIGAGPGASFSVTFATPALI